MTERDRVIQVMMNRTIKGKMSATATPADWQRYHEGFTHEATSARGLAADIYRGYSFCPVYEGRRKQENFSKAYHIAFDFDENGIDDLQKLVWVDYFISFAYATPSSTADNPKCRAVFIFEQPITDATYYRELYHAMAYWFERDGMKTDPACKDVIRLYYGSPRGEVWPNWSILATPTQAHLIADYRQANPEQPAPTTPTYSRPAKTADEQRVRDALRYIPAWGDYHDWLTVLMAVHSEYPNRIGVALCEGWSPGSDGEIVRKFRSFDAGGQGRVNIGSLFHLAKQYGYVPEQRQRPATGARATQKQIAEQLSRA